MSRFLLGAGPAQLLIGASDERAAGEWFRNDEDLFLPRLVPKTWEKFSGFASSWWPHRSGFLGGESDPFDGCDNSGTQHADMWTRSGCNGRLAFVAFSRDENGNVVAGCTIKCFRTADDSLQASVLSDANGYYQATTPYYEAHYLVIQMPTTPPRSGASLNTILPG